MNHYPHHIGDFNNATRHLSRLERSIYRDLLDLYYDTEAPIPAQTDWVCRRILAGSQDERAAVELVLSEFFTKDGDTYRNARCDAEIEAYRARRDRARANGCKGGRPSERHKTQSVISGMPEGTQKKTNQNQNQNQYVSPDGDTGRASRSQSVTVTELVTEHAVGEQVAKDYLALRKAKRAPLTRTALAGLIREFHKAGLTVDAGLHKCIEKGWQGFKADWLANENGRNHGTSNGGGRPRGFEHTDAIGEQWVREQQQLERDPVG